MYLHRNMKNIGLDSASAPAMYSYNTTDTLETVTAAGYFNDPRLQAQVGDTVLINASNGTDMLVFSSATTAGPKNSTSTGWGTYADTLYTVGSPFALAANTDTILPNNGLSKIEAQKPIDVDTFYDGTVITGRNGDGLSITFDLKAVPASATNTYIDIWIDIGGAVGELYRRTLSFSKGAVTYSLNASFTGYTLDTWEANGGTVYVRSNTTVDLYAIRYIITRTHKART